MEIILSVLMMACGLVTGFIVGRCYEEVKREEQAHKIHEPIQPEQPKWLKQYNNFLTYDGTGKGQANLED